MSFDQSYSDVLGALEVMDVQLTDADVFTIASRLDAIRCVDGTLGCLRYRGSGVFTWVKNRILEYKLMPPLTAQDTEGYFVTCVMHFWAWDTEKYGEFSGPFTTDFKSGVQRSPLTRLIDAAPVNKTANKVFQIASHNCDYCNRYFRNPAALKLHMRDVHQYEEE
jgi:hypothetical protein